MPRITTMRKRWNLWRTILTWCYILTCKRDNTGKVVTHNLLRKTVPLFVLNDDDNIRKKINT